MKIIRVIFLISIILFLLCSCSLAGIRLNQLSNNDDFAIASNKMEIIIKAIETNDNALLKSVFSINALTEIDDIDANMNSLFDYINGNIDTWEQNSQIVDQTNSHGVKVRKARTWYTVNTNSNEYMFLLVDYTIDTENPDNVGLYMLEVLENKDRYEYDITGMNNPIAGIWLPSKNNTNKSISTRNDILTQPPQT